MFLKLLYKSFLNNSFIDDLLIELRCFFANSILPVLISTIANLKTISGELG